MSNSKKMVTLASGKEVSWDEFSKWSIYKQRNNLVSPSSFKQWGDIEYYKKVGAAQRLAVELGRKAVGNNSGYRNGQAKIVLTPKGQYPSITAAAEAYEVDKTTLAHWVRVSKRDEFYFADGDSYINNEKTSGRPKKVKSPDGIFDSIQAAADYYKVGRQCIVSWIKSKAIPGFSFIADPTATTKSAKPVQTPSGIFPSKKAAALHYGVRSTTIQKWINQGGEGFSFAKN